MFEFFTCLTIHRFLQLNYIRFGFFGFFFLRLIIMSFTNYMNEEIYLDILTNNFLPREEGHWVLHQDIDPKLNSRLCRGFLEIERVLWVMFFI